MKLTNLEIQVIKELEYAVQNNCSKNAVAKYFGVCSKTISNHFNATLPMILKRFPDHKYYNELYNLYNSKNKKNNINEILTEEKIISALKNIISGSNYIEEAKKLNIGKDTLRSYTNKLGTKNLEVKKLLDDAILVGKERKLQKNPISDEVLYKAMNNVLINSTFEKEASSIGVIPRTLRIYMRALAARDINFSNMYNNKKQLSNKKSNNLNNSNALDEKIYKLDGKYIPVQDIVKIGKLLVKEEITFSVVMMYVPYDYTEIIRIFLELLPQVDIDLYENVCAVHMWHNKNIEKLKGTINVINKSVQKK